MWLEDVNPYVQLFLFVLVGLPLSCEGTDPDARDEQVEQEETVDQNNTSGRDAFSMERYAWENRPLLVFAPSSEDQRYKKQKRGVEQVREGFRERDMVLIQVFSSGDASRAGDRPLRSTEAKKLRTKYDVHPDSFAVLLVGKDTGVKRRSTGPVEMQDLFDQIDRMPMRRREMQENTQNK